MTILTQIFASSPIWLNITSTKEIDGIGAWVVDIMDRLGGLGAAFLIALENIFPPLPSEIILPAAGFAAADPTSNMSLIGALLWCTAGSLIGAWILYGMGAWLGRERTRKILLWLPLTKQSDVDNTENWFDKNGTWTVFFGRMVPIFRSLISLPAGVTRMPFLKFTLLTTAGSAIWNSILIGAGYALGANWEVVGEYVDIFSKIVLVACLLILILWIMFRVRKIQREKSRPEEPSTAVVEREENVETPALSEAAPVVEETVAPPAFLNEGIETETHVVQENPEENHGEYKPGE